MEGVMFWTMGTSPDGKLPADGSPSDDQNGYVAEAMGGVLEGYSLLPLGLLLLPLLGWPSERS